jgi:hypothetical protein
MSFPCGAAPRKVPGKVRDWPAAAIGAAVHLLAAAIEEGRDLSSISGSVAGTAYLLLPA